MEGKIPKISVIVPVYNAESRLQLCVENILRQTFADFELILVDDGSKDSSPQICDSFSESDARVRVLHKNNGGVSQARNDGIRIASGEYITFIDSDDTVNFDYFENMLKKAESTDIDGLYSGLVMETWSDTSMIKQDIYSFDEEDVKDVKELLESMEISYPLICICGPCCKLYKRAIVEKYQIRFDEKLALGEDTIFNLNYLEHCSRIMVTTDSYYHYYRGDSSSLFSKLNKECYEIHVNVYDKMRELMINTECSSEAMERFEEMYVNLMVGCIHRFFQFKDETTVKERIEIIKKVASNNYVKAFRTSSIGMKSRFVVYLLQHNLIKQIYFIFWINYYIRELNKTQRKEV